MITPTIVLALVSIALALYAAVIQLLATRARRDTAATVTHPARARVTLSRGRR